MGRLRTELKKGGLQRNTILISMTDNGTTHSKVHDTGMRGQKNPPTRVGNVSPVSFTGLAAKSSAVAALID